MSGKNFKSVRLQVDSQVFDVGWLVSDFLIVDSLALSEILV